MEKRILGQPLSEDEDALLGEMLETTHPVRTYHDEEIFWDVGARESFVKEIDRFRRSGKEEQILVVRDGYDRPTKETKTFRFELKRGLVVIIDGKYANREELAACYHVRYRLYDNPDRTKAKFEMRTRSLSPATADNQMRFYDVGLVPSFRVYARRTKDAIDWVIDLRGDDWELVRPTESAGRVWESVIAPEEERQMSSAPMLVH
jgi:hypothetical protein